MKHVSVFFAIAGLTVVAFFPAAARADEMEGLDVTMEVLDDVGDLDDTISRMRGPSDVGVSDDDWEDSEEEAPDDIVDGDFDEDSGEDEEDGFDDDDMDDDFEDYGDFEDYEVEEDDDLDDGDDVDDDTFEDEDDDDLDDDDDDDDDD